MPRQHRRKTTRWINEDCMQSAVRDICAGIETPSTAARKYGLKRTTIIYRVEKKQKMDLIQRGKCPEASLIATPLMAEIFSVKQEKELMEYLNRYTYLPYDTSGSYKAARQLVYQFVKEHDIKHPKTWDIEQQAGVDWLKGFILRNPETNLRNSTSATNKMNDQDEESSLDTDKKPIIAKKRYKTEPIAQTMGETSKKKIIKPIGLSEQSLESNTSSANSSSSFLESRYPLQDDQLYHQNSNSCDAENMNECSEIELEPECQITVVSIKEEPATTAAADENIEEHTAYSNNSFVDSKAQIIPKLDTVPENDDVFNSFGRNVAFQVKEMFQHNQVEALELMHEVQTTVNRRLINMLRLNGANSRINSAKRARRQYHEGNGDDV